MSDKREGKSFLVYRVFSGGFSVTKVKCYVSVQVTYLLDSNDLAQHKHTPLVTGARCLNVGEGTRLTCVSWTPREGSLPEAFKSEREGNTFTQKLSPL